MKLFKQSVIIALSAASVFLITNTRLATYAIPILAFTILLSLLYVVLMRRKKKDGEIFTGSLLEVFAIITVILLIIFLTEGIHSPIFFLTYFLLFGISFLFEPITIFVFLVAMIALFLKDALADDVFTNMVRLASLALLSPIAFFFGREFQKREKLEENIRKKTSEIIQDAQHIMKSKKTRILREEREKLEEIVRSSDELRRETQK